MKNKDSESSADLNSLLVEKEFSSEQVYDGKLLKVYCDRVTLPDQSVSTREWIKHPGACAVVPVFEDGTIMLLKQFRYPPRKIFIEVPAGKIDPGEDPLRTAKRELLEETGVECRQIIKTGSFYPAIGYADEIIHTYAAWGLAVKSQKVDEDEFLQPYRISFRKAIDMIGSGDITDAKTISALIQTRMWWEREAPFPVSF